MLIGLDLDGLVVDSHGLKKRLLKEIFDLYVPLESCRHEQLRFAGAETLRKYLHVQCLVYENPEYHRQLRFMPGALKCMRLLRNEGHQLLIVSSRRPVAAALAREFLKTHHVTDGLAHFMSVGGHFDTRKKYEVAYCDVYVDDDVWKLDELLGVVPHLYLFRQAHNLVYRDLHKPIERVSGWRSLVRKIRTL